MALARALINRSAIILADEPTGNLDSKNSDIVLNMLRQSNKELGQTVLMITHNPEAARIGDRIIHMRDGAIVKPEKDPQWVARYRAACFSAALYSARFSARSFLVDSSDLRASAFFTVSTALW